MKSFAKKILTGIVVSSFIFTGVTQVYAEKQPQKQFQEEMTDWAKYTANWSGVSEKDIMSAVKAGKHYEDIDFAAMLSKISGKSFNEVLAMKTDWSDVMKKLGISDDVYDTALQEVTIKNLAVSSELDISTVKKLLENHYHPNDIHMAGRIAKASGKNVQEILDMKKINQRWIDVADELNVDRFALMRHNRRMMMMGREDFPMYGGFQMMRR